MRALRIVTYGFLTVGFCLFMWSFGRQFRSSEHSHVVDEDTQVPPSEPLPTATVAETVLDPVTNRRTDQSPIGQLVAAAAEDDVEGVSRLLATGVLVDSLDAQGYGALHQAAATDSPEVVRRVLDAGASIDHLDGIGWTPLTWAAYMGSRRAVVLLMDAGADPNLSAPPNFVTPLQQLVGGWSMAQRNDPSSPPLRIEHRLGIAELLLATGTDPNDPPGQLLQKAALIKNAELVELLVSHGASINGASHRDLLVRLPGTIGDLLRESVETAPISDDGRGADAERP